MKIHSKQSWDSLVQGGKVPPHSNYYHYSKYAEHYGRSGQKEMAHNIPALSTNFRDLGKHVQ